MTYNNEAIINLERQTAPAIPEHLRDVISDSIPGLVKVLGDDNSALVRAPRHTSESVMESIVYGIGDVVSQQTSPAEHSDNGLPPISTVLALRASGILDGWEFKESVLPYVERQLHLRPEGSLLIALWDADINYEGVAGQPEVVERLNYVVDESLARLVVIGTDRWDGQRPEHGPTDEHSAELYQKLIGSFVLDKLDGIKPVPRANAVVSSFETNPHATMPDMRDLFTRQLV